MCSGGNLTLNVGSTVRGLGSQTQYKELRYQPSFPRIFKRQAPTPPLCLDFPVLMDSTLSICEPKSPLLPIIDFVVCGVTNNVEK